jgi:hypothetical protein
MVINIKVSRFMFDVLLQKKFWVNCVLLRRIVMQTVIQALQSVISWLKIFASPVLVIALIIAGFNMASSDSGRHEKAKRQLIGIAIAAILIYGASYIVTALISLVPGSSSF